MQNKVLGIMCRGDNSGLGNQTRRMVYLLRPEKILYIDSTSFAKNKKQHPEWYDGFNGYKVNGFPNNHEVRVFMKGLTHFICCENPHNFLFFSLGKQLGIKTYCVSNYEFCDNLDRPNLPLPHKFLMPSHWKIEEMRQKFGNDLVEYLPPPIDPNEFKEARERNFERKDNAISTPMFLHIVGTLAENDRNGTLDLLEALKHTKSNFKLIIKSQHPLPENYTVHDSRVLYSINNEPDPSNLYKDFDAMIKPRRYGGLCLSCNEALMSGLPVFMTDISPNNKLLPSDWLFEAKTTRSFYTRTNIDIYESNIKQIAKKIDWIVKQDLDKMKIKAFEIGYNNFSPAVLKSKYEKLFV